MYYALATSGRPSKLIFADGLDDPPPLTLPLKPFMARLTPASSLFRIGNNQKLVGVLLGTIENNQDVFMAQKALYFGALST